MNELLTAIDEMDLGKIQELIGNYDYPVHTHLNAFQLEKLLSALDQLAHVVESSRALGFIP